MDIFSKRNKLVNPKSPQIDSMDDDLRNSLWNLLDDYFWSKRILRKTRTRALLPDYYCPELKSVVKDLWIDCFKLIYSDLELGWRRTLTNIRKVYFSAEWFKIYDIIEFMMPKCDVIVPGSSTDYIRRCNEILTRENSGYRFIGSIIAPITNEIEINEIEEAIVSPHAAINEQLQSALEKLSRKKDPDYRNSIKDSINAVETACSIIYGDKATLGEALKKIREKISLHTTLEIAFQKLYGYTNDAEGIRHGLMAESSLDSEDARFMLVSCSAFINYILIKAHKAEILE
jgi:hypothetical protein